MPTSTILSLDRLEYLYGCVQQTTQKYVDLY